MKLRSCVDKTGLRIPTRGTGQALQRIARPIAPLAATAIVMELPAAQWDTP